jgi:hypothetical protein
MFPRSTPPPLTRRARNALSLARSFLLLEDDYDVDWEVDQDELGRDRSKIDGISDRSARGRADAVGGSGAVGEAQAVGRRGTVDGRSTPSPHPHRAPLRGRAARERAGQPPTRPQVCISPVPALGPAGGDSRARGDRIPRRHDTSVSLGASVAQPRP